MRELEVIRLENSNQAVLEILNYGATVVGLNIPDKHNKLINVILGLYDPKDYLDANFQQKGLFLGSTVGRYAGRISKNGFRINEQYYGLYDKDGIHLHGGKEGFDKKFWDIDHVQEGKNPFVTLSYISKHLEEGYPGNVKVTVRYQLKENNAFSIEYRATTDRPTHINLTNHSYFNLSGKGSIIDQTLYINSKQYLEVDDRLIPTGNFKNFEDAHFQFMQASVIESDFTGFDDTFVLNDDHLKASLYAENTGICMNIRTNQPAMVVYTPKVINDVKFKGGATYGSFPAICFESQKFSDAPNNAHFPSTLINPNNTYINHTSFEFNVDH